MLDNSWIHPSQAQPIDGSAPFIGLDATVADFWGFAMNDLRVNNVRGYLAEFLVARALGLNEARRVEWDECDLRLEWIKVEVKSSAYLQAWEQPRLSRISFSGLRGTRYDPHHQFDPAGKHLNAHIYVFCVQTAKRHVEYDPLDVNQWSFYVVKRSALERHGGHSIGLSAVIRLAGAAKSWAELREAVVSAAAGEEFDEHGWWSEEDELDADLHSFVAVAVAGSGEGFAEEPGWIEDSKPETSRPSRLPWTTPRLRSAVKAMYPDALRTCEAFLDAVEKIGLTMEGGRTIGPACAVDVVDQEVGVVGFVRLRGYSRVLGLELDFNLARGLAGSARQRFERFLDDVAEIVSMAGSVQELRDNGYTNRKNTDLAILPPADLASLVHRIAEFNNTPRP